MKKVDIGRSQNQGRRNYMEDTVAVSKGAAGVFLGVFDGHSGRDAARIAAKRMPAIFYETLRRERDPRKAFALTYQLADQAITGSSGTCAATAFLYPASNPLRLAYAWAGDCRVLVVNEKGTVRQLTRDHRVTNAAERKRALAAGASVFDHPTNGEQYLMGGTTIIMPTRSLGDHGVNVPGLISKPQTGVRTLGPEDRWIVLACDGLFDVMKSAAVGLICVKQQTGRRIANELVRHALRIGAFDNLSVVAARIG